MIQFSNCKINLGLDIISKREDGYHNIETCFFPIPFYDVVEVIQNATFQFSCSGLKIDATPENNLCVKAYQLLKKDFIDVPPIHLHLLKNIPMGAGIGGGSANAAFTLQLLNKKFNLEIDKATLKEYAASLGSDCTFFIENTPCLATGKGELLEPVKLDLSHHTIVLLFPKIHVSTKDAFAAIIPKQPSKKISEIIRLPIEEWKHFLKNDFEESIFPIHPMLHTLKQKLYTAGAIYASMSGSGSTIYGIFKTNDDVENLLLKQNLNIDYKFFKL